MSTQLNLPYVRFVRQVSTSEGALTQFVARMSEAFEALKVADWRLAANDPDDVALPVNYPIGWALSDNYDAFKASTTTSGSGKQIVHMGMAAYRFKVPADAIADSSYVAAMLATVGADKFAYSGLKVAVVLSDDATPPTDWDMLRSGGCGSTPDATGKFSSADEVIDSVSYGVLNSRAYASVSAASNQSTALTFDLSSVAANYAYLYIVISMYDYTDYRANRPYWVEGSGLVNGASALTTFAADVVADSDTVWDGWQKIAGNYSTSIAAPYYHQANISLLQTGGNWLTVDGVLDIFPLTGGASAGAATYAQFDGETGASVGIDTGKKVYGAACYRIFPMFSGQSVSALKFGASTLLDLSGKSMRVLMSVHIATMDATLSYNSRIQLKQTIAGIEQAALWRGVGSAEITVGTSYLSGSSAVDGADLTFSRLATFVLESGKKYDSSSQFDLSLSGPGLKILLITFMPIAYSGTVGTDTLATLYPGEFWYIQ